MNAEQKKLIADMQSGELSPVQVVSTTDANHLIGQGLAKHARIDPQPEEGMAINLTAKGRGYSPVSRRKPVERHNAVDAAVDASETPAAE